MRKIDGKFHIEGDQIIKTSSGETIPLDEPVFLMRARDYLALPLLREYRRLSVADHCTDYHMEGLEEMIQAFEDFAKSQPHQMKQPGVTRGQVYEPKSLVKAFAELGKTILAAATSTPADVHLKVKRSCNRHDDCDEADKKWFVAHPEDRWAPVDYHCHDENCEDCFGC